MPRRTPPVRTNTNRGPVNELHFAASRDSVKCTNMLLARGSLDIDMGDPTGYTPLMVAADQGSSRVAKILVDNGADVSIVGDNGLSALFISAQEGHVAITKILVKAGAPLETRAVAGTTPLFVAARKGHSEVMKVLIAAGAEVDSCAHHGATALGPTSPLFVASTRGHLDAVRQLLNAGANALLPAMYEPEAGQIVYESQQNQYLPLDIAAECGHSAVVRELVQQRGIEGCGGATGGQDALRLAAQTKHVENLATLTAAGVVDAGRALGFAASYGQEEAVKFLLRESCKEKTPSGGRGVVYANAPDIDGRTPLLSTISFCRSPRIARMLIDAGADTTSSVCVTNNFGVVVLDQTPMSFTVLSIREQNVVGSKATKEQLQTLEALRRLLLQVDAIRAVSWLWGSGGDVPTVAKAAVGGAAERRRSPKEVSAQQLTMVIPILRRRVRRRGVLLPALCRYSTKS